MLAVRYNHPASARTLFTLVLSSLLLVHVLAGTPQPYSNSPRSGAVIDSSAIGSLEMRRPDISTANPKDRAAPEAREEGTVVVERDAGHTTREVLDERARLGGAGSGGGERRDRKLDDLASTMLRLREPMGLEGGVHGRSSSSPVMTSAAGPTVFGVSVYLIVAWLALLYLMFRTGSISSTSDAKNYADELRE